MVFGPIHEKDNSEFVITLGIMLVRENSEFQVIVSCPKTKNDNSEFYFYISDRAWKSEFRVPSYRFLPYTAKR